MARPLYEIAREIAEEAVTTARCAGYEIKQERDPFTRSDVLDLADAISDWLDRHMRPERAPLP